MDDHKIVWIIGFAFLMSALLSLLTRSILKLFRQRQSLPYGRMLVMNVDGLQRALLTDDNQTKSIPESGGAPHTGPEGRVLDSNITNDSTPNQAPRLSRRDQWQKIKANEQDDLQLL